MMSKDYHALDRWSRRRLLLYPAIPSIFVVPPPSRMITTEAWSERKPNARMLHKPCHKLIPKSSRFVSFKGTICRVDPVSDQGGRASANRHLYFELFPAEVLG